MSWRDRIFFLVPILGIGFWPIVFGALVLASPFLISLLLLFLLGLAPFKWCTWLGWCYAVVAVSLLFWVWRGCSNGTTHGVPAETRANRANRKCPVLDRTFNSTLTPAPTLTSTRPVVNHSCATNSTAVSSFPRRTRWTTRFRSV